MHGYEFVYVCLSVYTLSGNFSDHVLTVNVQGKPIKIKQPSYIKTEFT